MEHHAPHPPHHPPPEHAPEPMGAPLAWLTVLVRGFRRRCPHCGRGHIFASYLKLRDCSDCGVGYAHINADDAPPYFTIVIVGHVIVPFLLLMERYAPIPMWWTIALWCAVTIALIAFLLPRVKGAVVGVMWNLGLKGDEYQ
ncbi:MAG: DUF983 domain-containing protein [Hyphomicrobiales bacterium]|nr:DUF983 domain-containing protein [Hyphomicrobiales bacterium]